MLRHAFPGCRISSITPLSGGYRNANFKVELASPLLTAVLRIYEHAASLCQKEIDLIRLVAAKVPVPEILFAATTETIDTPAFAIFKFVEGITLREMSRQAIGRLLPRQLIPAGECWLQSVNSVLKNRVGSALVRRSWVLS